MREFLKNLTSTRWGIVIIVAVCFVVWIVLSALLYRQFFKRFYDVLLSAIAILVLSPLLLMLTLLGALMMKGNPFFTQKRPGRIRKKTGEERIFKMIKFRTMTAAKDENGELLPDEKRLTSYGKFLRATSLDELPELLNILKGDMSIIGPRPQLVRDMVFMTAEQRRRHTVRPGLSGKAQTSGRNSIDWEEKLALDLRYIEHITLLGDLGLIFKTLFKVFKREGINASGLATTMNYGDYLLGTGAIDETEYNNKKAIAQAILAGASDFTFRPEVNGESDAN